MEHSPCLQPKLKRFYFNKFSNYFQAFAAFICSNEVAKDEELFQLCLELLRIILRDRSTADSDSFIPVLQLLLATTALDTQQKAAAKIEG